MKKITQGEAIMPIYADHAATHPIRACALEAMTAALRLWGNPSSLHGAGREAREALEEANFALSVMEGWELDLPLVYDWEYVSDTARTANVDRRTLTDCTKAFCRQVEYGGFEPMVYFNVSQARHLLYLEELTEFRFWLAQYLPGLDFAYRVDFWQYTGQGTVPGIEVPVDLNLWFNYSGGQ
jgi:GH25 family lysozyme M1 (1,4-beta-N-acetylmuramidase)